MKQNVLADQRKIMTVDASFEAYKALSTQIKDAIEEIDETHWQWSYRHKDEMKLRLVRLIEGIEVTIIFNRMPREDGEKPIMPQTLNICPSIPRIQHIFQVSLDQPKEIANWDKNQYAFRTVVNFENPSNQHHLRFFESESTIEEQLEIDYQKYQKYQFRKNTSTTLRWLTMFALGEQRLTPLLPRE